MIRAATMDDVPALVAFGRRFHEAAGQPFGFDPDAAAVFAQGVIASPAGCALVSDAGMIAGVLSPAYCAPDWRMAIEMAWWAEKDGLALLRAFEAWARDAGAQEVRMTSLASLPRADGLLKRLGYEPAEISYRKVI